MCADRDIVLSEEFNNSLENVNSVSLVGGPHTETKPRRDGALDGTLGGVIAKLIPLPSHHPLVVGAAQ